MQYEKLTTKFEEIIIELSYNCNLSCIMCGFGKDVNPFNKNKFMSFAKFRSILKQIGRNAKTIRLNGRGESTIHPDFVEILNYTKVHYPEVSINLFSNLSFNNMRILDALINNNVQLFISMDSPIAVELSEIRKGANFRFIKENIERLTNLTNRPFIIFTIQENNIHRIYDIGSFSYNNNCHILYNTIRKDEGIEPFIKMVTDNNHSITNQFLEVRKLYSGSNLQLLYPDQLAGIQLKVSQATQTHGTMECCPALYKELCIFYDGTVTPCNMFNPYVYGNIFKKSLGDIWSGHERLDFITFHKNYYYCKNCANLGL
jgi:radical SAM protein with 4Fe4S-binding SPASM domain